MGNCREAIYKYHHFIARSVPAPTSAKPHTKECCLYFCSYFGPFRIWENVNMMSYSNIAHNNKLKIARICSLAWSKAYNTFLQIPINRQVRTRALRQSFHFPKIIGTLKSNTFCKYLPFTSKNNYVKENSKMKNLK